MDFSYQSDAEFYSHFNPLSWHAMDARTQAQALQEAVNRESRRLGMTSAPVVSIRPGDEMQGAWGKHCPGEVHINEHRLDCIDPIAYDSLCSGWNSLTTALHETRHEFQLQVQQGSVREEFAGQRRLIDANSGFASVRDKEKGSLYLCPGGEQNSTLAHQLYMAQYKERDAFSYSERRVRDIAMAQQLTQKQLTADDLQAISRTNIAATRHGIDARLEVAAQDFADPQFTEHVDNTLLNMRYGESRPVHPTVDAAIRKMSRDTYQRLVRQTQSQQLGNARSENLGQPDRKPGGIRIG